MTAFENAEFWHYITTDEDGNMTGLREDAPESVWPDYEAFLEEQRYADARGMKI